jgi:exodeoxyribonuclease VII large subunit
MPELELTPGEFVAFLNQTLEFAYPSVVVVGELANFRISKNKWVYFDLKDDEAIVRCFGTVYQLPEPLEDGMLLKVRSTPRLHPQYGLSLNIQNITPSGEGTIKRAANLLEAKLMAEGLFAPERKRSLPYPPVRIGLIASSESAAYSDFIKIINQRWAGLEIVVSDVLVQGELAAEQVIQALEQMNQLAEPPDVIVLTRGGGSAEDLQAFSSELVVRAVAASRIPTIVAIGHERDISLAEMAADQRASTPSNAAELLTPDRRQVLAQLSQSRKQLGQTLSQNIEQVRQGLHDYQIELGTSLRQIITRSEQRLAAGKQLLGALNPRTILDRGFALVYKNGQLVRSAKSLKQNDTVAITFNYGQADASITSIKPSNV